jgi:hypothetical protein
MRGRRRRVATAGNLSAVAVMRCLTSNRAGRR